MQRSICKVFYVAFTQMFLDLIRDCVFRNLTVLIKAYRMSTDNCDNLALGVVLVQNDFLSINPEERLRLLQFMYVCL